jgi:hypothetical protein
MGGATVGATMDLVLGWDMLESMGVTASGQSGCLVLRNDTGFVWLKGEGFVMDIEQALDRLLEWNWISGTTGE